MFFYVFFLDHVLLCMDVCTICMYVSVYASIGGFPGGSVGNEFTCSMKDTVDVGSIPGSGIFPGGGHGNPLQYSCWKNPMDKEAWRAAVHRVAKSRT